MRILILALLSLLTTLPQVSTAKPAASITHVILITLDGVKREDMFGKQDLMPVFWKEYAPNAEIYGEPGSSKSMTVGAKIPYSLPSYQSMMSGKTTPCMDNECGRLKTETFPEALIKKAGLKRSEVASISSWEVMDDAFESKLGTAFSNHGTRPMHDPDKFTTDEIMTELNKKQTEGYPGDDTRWDKYTLTQAVHYYKTYQPKFLWISFGDADDYAHDNNLTGYEKTLAFYDLALTRIINMTKEAGLFDQTMFIITTDHGRGADKDWVEHEPSMPTAWKSWAIVLNGKLEGGKRDKNKERFSTLSIRPTVEKVFGLQ